MLLYGLELVASCRDSDSHMPFGLIYDTGGLPIENDDPRWDIYVSLEGEGPEIVVTGFCTVYRFYNYPESTRLRVSQVCCHIHSPLLCLYDFKD